MPKLRALDGSAKGREYALSPRQASLVGRQEGAAVAVSHAKTSRRHAELYFDAEKRPFVRDLGSGNGTMVNGILLSPNKPHPIRPGDELRFGEANFRYFSDSKTPSAAIPGHEILDVIAEGGMGTICLARQTAMARDVAIKILNPAYASRREFVERFIQEARSAGRLNHRNIIQVHNVGKTDDGTYYFTMELVRGNNLTQRMGDRRKLSLREIARVGACVAEALGYAHEQGIIHRDIKPDNIMISDADEVKLADLGIAKTEEYGEDNAPGRRVLGTPHYMSPEQACAREVDPRSDLYSLGATLYHAVAGRPVFEDATSAGIMNKHVHQKPMPLAKAAPDAPDSLCRIVDRLLRKNPNERYATADEVAEALKSAMRSLPDPDGAGPPTDEQSPAKTATAQMAGAAPGKLRLILWAGALAACAIVVANAAIRLAVGDPGEPDPLPIVGPAAAPLHAISGSDGPVEAMASIEDEPDSWREAADPSSVEGPTLLDLPAPEIVPPPRESERMARLEALVFAALAENRFDDAIAAIDAEADGEAGGDSGMDPEADGDSGVDPDFPDRLRDLRRGVVERAETVARGYREDLRAAFGQRAAMIQVLDEFRRNARYAQAEAEFVDMLAKWDAFGELEKTVAASMAARRFDDALASIAAFAGEGERDVPARLAAQAETLRGQVVLRAEAAAEMFRRDLAEAGQNPIKILILRAEYRDHMQYRSIEEDFERLAELADRELRARMDEADAESRDWIKLFDFDGAENIWLGWQARLLGTDWIGHADRRLEELEAARRLHTAFLAEISAILPWLVPGDFPVASLRRQEITGVTGQGINVRRMGTVVMRWEGFSPQDMAALYEAFFPRPSPRRNDIALYASLMGI